MKRSLTNLLRNATVAACCVCGIQAFAEGPSVVSAGGSSTTIYGCTIGEVACEAAGLWAAINGDFSTGIDGVYSDGEVTVGNVAADGSLRVEIPEAMIADGASYSIYTVTGMLLDRNQIDATPFIINYSDVFKGQVIVVTISTSKGVVGTYKISK